MISVPNFEFVYHIAIIPVFKRTYPKTEVHDHSTNLNMNQVADIYSERVLSRIMTYYTIIKLFGEDIRSKKRIH